MANFKDFICWDFGDRNGQVWDSEIGQEYGRLTQSLISQEMGLEFRPNQENDFLWFLKTLKQIKWLSEAQQLSHHQEWLSDLIRKYVTKDESIDTITGLPGIIHQKRLEDLVVYETDPETNAQFKKDLHTMNPGVKEVPLLLRRVCEEKRKMKWSELVQAVENDNSTEKDGIYGLLN